MCWGTSLLFWFVPEVVQVRSTNSFSACDFTGQTTSFITSISYDSFSPFHLWAGTADGGLIMFSVSNRMYSDEGDADGRKICEGVVARLVCARSCLLVVFCLTCHVSLLFGQPRMCLPIEMLRSRQRSQWPRGSRCFCANSACRCVP